MASHKHVSGHKNLKIYHITHIDNLRSIVDDVLWSDAERIRRKLDCTIVGISDIKRRRLQELEVDCHPGTTVGNYVPFYFCARSIMLYLLHMGNAPGLAYRGGQAQIIHCQADLDKVLDWAKEKHRRWAFTKVNAGAYYARFFNERADLDNLDWDAINAIDWRDPDIKESKQAEFLIEEYFPWALIEQIGVINTAIGDQVNTRLEGANHKPEVMVRRDWYY